MEAERIRYDRLRQVVRKAVEQTIRKLLNPEQLEKCFPTISKMEGGPDALETARKQIQRHFHSTCSKQFDYIVAERDIERKLDELDEVIHAAQNRRNQGADPFHVDELTASQILGASIGGSREDSVKKLSMIYEQLTLDNLHLFEELRELAAEGEWIKGDIELQIAALTSGIDEFKRRKVDRNLDALSSEVYE